MAFRIDPPQFTHVTRNIGDADRTARVFVGAVVGFFVMARRITGAPGVVIGSVCTYLLVTTLLGWCLIYALLRHSTVKPDDAPATRA